MVIEITIDVQPTTVLKGEPIFITGTVSENGVPLKANVYFIRDDNVDSGMTISAADGSYRYTITIWGVGTHQIWAIVNGYTSPVATFQVVEEIPPPPPEYTITVSAGLGGTTNPLPGSYTYLEGTEIEFTAIPINGYKFDHWQLNGEIYLEKIIHVILLSDSTLHAYFAETGVPPTPPISWMPIIIIGAVVLLALSQKGK